MSNKNNQKKLFPFVITDLYTACGIIEGFEPIPDDVDEYHAHIVAWQYGRTARDLIARGTCKARGEK